jgi:hypothetical protein
MVGLMVLTAIALLAATASATTYDHTYSAYDSAEVLRGGDVAFSWIVPYPDGLEPADSGDMLGLKEAGDYICMNCGQEAGGVAMATFTYDTGLSGDKDEILVTVDILTSAQATNALLIWNNDSASYEVLDGAKGTYGFVTLTGLRSDTLTGCDRYWDSEGKVLVAVIQYGFDWGMQLYVDYACIEVDMP